MLAIGIAVLVVVAAGAVMLSRSGTGGPPDTAGPTALPAPPAGMKWSGIATTVFAVPASLTMRPGEYCGSDDGRDWLDITQWHVSVACPAQRMSTPPLPPSDVIDFEVDPKGEVHADASLPHPVAGFDPSALRASRMTLPAGWTAVPTGVPTEGVGPPTAASEVSALKAAGFRTRVKQVAYWAGPEVTTVPEIGAPARIGSLVTVNDAIPAPAVAQLSGTLVETGGPVPGTPRPVSGWVHVRGGVIDEYLPTDAHGRWSVSIPGGTPYTITGAFTTTSSRRADESCRVTHAVTPRTEQFAANSGIDVLCSAK